MTDRRAEIFGVLLLICIFLSFLEAPSQNQPDAAGNSSGRHLVEEAARCWECQAPMAEGHWEMDAGSHALVPAGAAHVGRAYSAPGIAELRNFSDQQSRAVLEKGIGPNGHAIRLPMHSYHLSPENTQAIIC